MSGKPIVSCVRTAQAKHDAAIVEQLEICVSDDVGRHRKWQQEEPLEYAAPWEAVHSHEPSSASANQKAEGTNACH